MARSKPECARLIAEILPEAVNVGLAGDREVMVYLNEDDMKALREKGVSLSEMTSHNLVVEWNRPGASMHRDDVLLRTSEVIKVASRYEESARKIG